MMSSKVKGLEMYKKHWEEQASFIDQSPWNLRKILKLTFSNGFDKNIEELRFSNHSISREDGKLILRLNVPYNYSDIDDFELKSIDLLGIDNNWLLDFSVESSNCTHNLQN